MKSLFPIVLLLALGGAAAVLLLADGDDPGPAGTGPVVEHADQSREIAGPRPSGDAPVVADGPSIEREAVVLTADGDVADVPLDAMRTAELGIVVLSEFGDPLSGAALRLAAGFPGRSAIPVPFVDFAAEEICDAEGRATFAVPPVGVYTATATQPGYAGESFGPIVPGDEVTIRLAPGQALTGVVLELGSNQPIEAAVVQLTRGSEMVESSTDALGAFRLDDLAAASFELAVAAPGFDFRQRTVSVPHEDGVLELRLAPGLIVSGVVQNAATGDAVEGATVAVEGNGILGGIALPASVLSGADGRFTFSQQLSRRGTRLEVRAPGFALERAVVKAKEGAARADVFVDLYRGAEVTGVVTTPDGAPAADVRVRLRDLPKDERKEFKTRTEADGSFVIEGVRPERRFTLVAGDPESGYAPARVEGLLIPDGETLPPLEIALVRGASLSGTVLDGSGIPVAHARVLVDGIDGETWKALKQKPIVFSDEDGRYHYSALPSSTLEVSAEHEGRVAPAQPVTLVEAGEHLIDLRLDEGGVLTGLIVDTRGAPIDDALITASAVTDGFVPPTSDNLRRALKDSDRKSVGRGKSSAPRKAAKKNAKAARKEQKSGRTGSRSAERILRAATGGRENRLTAFRSLARADAQGRFRLTGLYEGELLALVVRREGFVPRHEFGIDPTRGEVRIALPALVNLTGRVIDAATRRPLEVFRVQVEPDTTDGASTSLGDVLSAPRTRQIGVKDENGTFEMKGLQPGTWLVSVTARNYRPTEPVRVDVAPGLTGNVLLEAAPASIVRIDVRGPRGDAIAGVRVSMKPAAGNGRSIRRVTDGKGRTTFFDPPLGDHVVLVGDAKTPITTPVKLSLHEGESVTRDLVVAGVGTAVVDLRSGSGFGIPHAKLRLRGLASGQRRTVKADSRGIARVTGLLPGGFRVTGSAKGHESLTDEITVRAGADTEVTLHLKEVP